MFKGKKYKLSYLVIFSTCEIIGKNLLQGTSEIFNLHDFLYAAQYKDQSFYYVQVRYCFYLRGKI